MSTARERRRAARLVNIYLLPCLDGKEIAELESDIRFAATYFYPKLTATEVDTLVSDTKQVLQNKVLEFKRKENETHTN